MPTGPRAEVERWRRGHLGLSERIKNALQHKDADARQVRSASRAALATFASMSPISIVNFPIKAATATTMTGLELAPGPMVALDFLLSSGASGLGLDVEVSSCVWLFSAYDIGKT